MMEYVELNQVVNLVSGFAIPSGDMVGDYAKVIKITNIKEDGSIDLDNTAGYCKPVAEKLSKYLLRDNDIIICMTGATIGKVAKASKVTGKYIVNQRVAIVRAKNKEEQNYYYHILSMPLFRRYTELVGYGAAQPNISLTQIGKFTFLHHASSRDRLIVSFVLSAYHDLIGNNQKRIKLLEQMTENLYKEWFVRFRFPGYENAEFEGGVPKEWDYKPLGEIVSFERGLSYSSEEIDCEDGLNLVNLKNIEAFGGYRRDGLKHYNGKYKTAQVVKKGDLVMGVTDMTQDRRTVGAVALIPDIPGTSVISADLVKIVSKQPNLFLYCLCRFGYYSKFFSQFANGANVLHLKPNTLLNKKVLMPTDHLIKMFVKNVQASIECIDDLYKQNDILTHQRDLLLPRLMSGKLSI